MVRKSGLRVSVVIAASFTLYASILPQSASFVKRKRVSIVTRSLCVRLLGAPSCYILLTASVRETWVLPMMTFTVSASVG